MLTLPEGPYRRRTARVLLVNDEERILLFRFARRKRRLGVLRRRPAAFTWMTPGGGVNDGEDLAAAAARELFEETNLRVTPEELGAPVAAAAGYADLGWAEGIFRDDFFFHRVPQHEVDLRNADAYEPDAILEIRWWPVGELAASTERVLPFGLAPLVARLLAEGRPAEPATLPWHHARPGEPEPRDTARETPDAPDTRSDVRDHHPIR
jgi:8-oxo-dGTP pyrophosphatase MutT (NUDIX family)